LEQGILPENPKKEEIRRVEREKHDDKEEGEKHIKNHRTRKERVEETNTERIDENNFFG
jgi:hypothetical protein